MKFIVRADREAERAENRVEWSEAVSRSCRKERWSGARSGVRGLITEIGWSVEWLQTEITSAG